MTVDELIVKLQSLPPELRAMPVLIYSNYGYDVLNDLGPHPIATVGCFNEEQYIIVNGTCYCTNCESIGSVPQVADLKDIITGVCI